MLLAFIAVAHASPGCLEAVAGASGTPAVPAAPARVVVKLRLSNASVPAEVADTIDAFDAVELPLTVSVPASWRPEHADQIAGPNVEIALRTSVVELLSPPPSNPAAVALSDWRAAIKGARRDLRKNTGAQVRTVSIAPPPPGLELMLDDSGLRTILLEDPGAGDPPRVARSWGGQPGRARLLSEQGYDDGCGAVVRAPTSAALDRISRAGPRVPVLRVVLLPEPDTARMFVGWWTTVAVPAGWQAVTPRQAGVQAVGAWLPRPQAKDATPGTPSTVTARRLSSDELNAAAQAIIDARRLPRTLPGGLSLTEAFVGLNAWTASPQDTVLLPTVGGPTTVPSRSSRPPAAVELHALEATAQTLSSAVSQTIPSLVTVGSETLTAREYLVALAHHKLGLSPIARDTPDPDPYAPGGGWGTSEAR